MLLGKQCIRFILFYCLTVSAFAMSKQVEDSGKVVDVKTDRVEVKLFLRDLAKGECNYINKWMWGTENTCPRNVAEKLSVKYLGESAYIPVSSYSDLSNVKEVVIDKGREDSFYTIKISGGDAAFSYYSVLSFKGITMLSRAVHHGEFPEDSWEKTQYKFNDLNN